MRATLYNRCLTAVALQSAARTNGTATGATVDCGVYGNNFRVVLFVITTGAITDGSHAVKVQESDDNSSWGDAAADVVQGSAPTIGSADDNVVFQVGYIGGKRYCRLSVTTSGATTGGVFSATAVLSAGSASPVVRS